MSDITAYIFPETLPKESLLHPLVHVFPTIVYLRTVEEDPGFAFPQGSALKNLLDEKRLRLHTPAPLGNDRERFLSLVNDIENRRTDYAGMLSNLALAHVGSGGQSESKQSIISSLVGARGKKNTAEDSRTMLLWQARLVLKLGEMFEREQQDIAESLARLTEKQDSLFAELREETNQPFALTREIADSIHGSDEMLDHRLKAWAQLCCLGGDKPAAPLFFITPKRDALEKLKDQFESSSNLPCPEAVVIDLPLLKADAPSDQFPPASTAPALEKLCTKLLENELSDETKGILLDTWEQELAGICEEEIYHTDNRVRLTLQPFDNTPWERLMLETFSRTTVLPEPEKMQQGRFVVGALEVV